MSDAEHSRPEIDTGPVAGESDVVFPRLDPVQIETLRAAGRTAQLETGEILYSPGELDYDLIVVVSRLRRDRRRDRHPARARPGQLRGPPVRR